MEANRERIAEIVSLVFTHRHVARWVSPTEVLGYYGRLLF